MAQAHGATVILPMGVEEARESILGAHDSNPPAQSTDHAYWSHQRMADLFYTYVLRGDMRVTDLIAHRYSPADASEAYRMLREERATAMGALFDWTQL